MRRFTQLFCEMDRTTRSSVKIAAMVRHFREAPPDDAAWGLFFLSGRKIKRLVTWDVLDEAIRIETSLPAWLVSASYEAVGDAAEMMALLDPHVPPAPLDEPLHRLVAERLMPLRAMADPKRQRDAIRASWSAMTPSQRLVFNKLLTGNFRVGVAQTTIIRALAQAADVSPAVMAHRFAGAWEPTGESLVALLRGERVPTAGVSAGDAHAEPQAAGGGAQPYPFLLGYPLQDDPAALGEIDHWQIEWKYDGLRAQIIRRPSVNMIWSRGEEVITSGFPEIAQAAAHLPEGSVLDGEIAAWDMERDRPLPFALLQRRINRRNVEATLWPDVPVSFIAFDLLERDGRDMRAQPLRARRTALEQLIAALPADARTSMRLSPQVSSASWDDLAQQRLQSRERCVEGVMLKRRDSVYAVGSRKGEWWKWKIDPYTIDAVLIYAQGGSGRRSGLFTDYTFGVWSDDGELVPVAKAYSGLTDEEIREVDRFIRRHTLEKRGPVRIVKPELVFELAFEGIAESDRHRSKIALRFPRMHRWRTDKKPQDADTLETLRALLRSHISRGSGHNQAGRQA